MNWNSLFSEYVESFEFFDILLALMRFFVQNIW